MTDEELVQAIENVVGSAIKASEERMAERISAVDKKRKLSVKTSATCVKTSAT